MINQHQQTIGRQNLDLFILLSVRLLHYQLLGHQLIYSFHHFLLEAIFNLDSHPNSLNQI